MREFASWEQNLSSRHLPTFAIVAIGQAPAASFVPPRLPYGVDHALAVAAQHARVAVGVPVGGEAIGQAKSLDMAARQADGQQGFRGVQGGREDVCLQWQRAEILEHGERDWR